MRLTRAAWRLRFIPAVRELMNWGGAVKEMWLRNLIYSDCTEEAAACATATVHATVLCRQCNAQCVPDIDLPISVPLIHHCLPLPSTPHIHPSITSLSRWLARSVFQRGVQNNTSHHSIKLYVPPFHAPYLSSFDFSIGRPWEIHSGTLFNSTGPFLSSSPCLSDGQRARGVILLFRHLFISFFLSVGQNAMISCWAGVLSSFSLSFLSCSSLRAPLLPLRSTQAMTYSFTPGFIMFGHAFLTVCFF